MEHIIVLAIDIFFFTLFISTLSTTVQSLVVFCWYYLVRLKYDNNDNDNENNEQNN